MARVAVVDDEALVRSMLRELMERMGHTVEIEAGTTEEALEKLETDRVDLVITDIVMPGEFGLEVIRNVKLNAPSTRVVAMTGYNPDRLALAEQLGADQIIRKPFGLREMKKVVEEALGPSKEEAGRSG